MRRLIIGCDVAACLLLATGLAHAASSCGGYREALVPGQTYSLTSPNFPDPYPRNQRCVWLFTATAGTGFVVNVTSADLEGWGNDNATCRDYLQITEGSSRANQLAYLCQVSRPVQFTGDRLYLWIKFQSNHQVQGSGFQLSVRTVQSGNASSNGTPIISCNITRFTCPNKECIYQGSLCDNVNDCGCEDYGCDETRCWKFTSLTDTSVIWGIGTGLGLAVSLGTFIICGFLEMPDRQRPDCLKRRPLDAASGNGCLARCGRKNRVEQQTAEDAFMAMMRRMTGDHVLRWDAEESESEASRSASQSATPRTSISGPAGGSVGAGSPSASRRSSLYTPGPPVYGKTLSPKDSLKVAASAAAAATGGRVSAPPGPRTLAVPNVTGPL